MGVKGFASKDVKLDIDVRWSGMASLSGLTAVSGWYMLALGTSIEL